MRRIRTKSFFDQFYQKVSPWGVKLGDRRLAYVLSLFSGKGKEKILDVGCGEGIFLAMLLKKYPQVNAYGTDIVEVTLERAKKIVPKADVKNADAQDLPFSENTFDWVFCLEVLYYLSNFEKALGEIRRVIRPKGKAVIGVTLGAQYFSFKKFRQIIQDYFLIEEEKILFPKPLPLTLGFLSQSTILTTALEKILPEPLALKAYFVVKVKQ